MTNPFYIFVGMATATLGLIVAQSHDRWDSRRASATEIMSSLHAGDVYDRIAKGLSGSLAQVFSRGEDSGGNTSSVHLEAEEDHQVAHAVGIESQSNKPNDQQEDGARAMVDDVQRKLTLLQTELGRATKLDEEHTRALHELETKLTEVQQKLKAAGSQLSDLEQRIQSRSQEIESLDRRLASTRQREAETSPFRDTAGDQATTAGTGSLSVGGSRPESGSVSGTINEPHPIKPIAGGANSKTKLGYRAKAKSKKTRRTDRARYVRQGKPAPNLR